MEFPAAVDLLSLEREVTTSASELRPSGIDCSDLSLLAAMLEQSPVSIVLTDAAGIIEYVNRQFTQLTGYTPDEVIGKSPALLNSGMTPRQTYAELWGTISDGVWRGERSASSTLIAQSPCVTMPCRRPSSITSTERMRLARISSSALYTDELLGSEYTSPFFRFRQFFTDAMEFLPAILALRIS